MLQSPLAYRPIERCRMDVLTKHVFGPSETLR